MGVHRHLEEVARGEPVGRAGCQPDAVGVPGHHVAGGWVVQAGPCRPQQESDALSSRRPQSKRRDPGAPGDTEGCPGRGRVDLVDDMRHLQRSRRHEAPRMQVNAEDHLAAQCLLRRNLGGVQTQGEMPGQMRALRRDGRREAVRIEGETGRRPRNRLGFARVDGSVGRPVQPPLHGIRAEPHRKIVGRPGDQIAPQPVPAGLREFRHFGVEHPLILPVREPFATIPRRGSVMSPG